MNYSKQTLIKPIEMLEGFDTFLSRFNKEYKGKVIGTVDGCKAHLIYALASHQKKTPVIITSDELGCGIVPFDPADREWREVSGRASVRLARISREVYRMVCGIATQIK